MSHFVLQTPSDAVRPMTRRGMIREGITPPGSWRSPQVRQRLCWGRWKRIRRVCMLTWTFSWDGQKPDAKAAGCSSRVRRWRPSRGTGNYLPAATESVMRTPERFGPRGTHSTRTFHAAGWTRSWWSFPASDLTPSRLTTAGNGPSGTGKQTTDFRRECRISPASPRLRGCVPGCGWRRSS